MKHNPANFRVFLAPVRAMAAMLCVLCAAPSPASAQGTVWNGPLVYFSEPAGDNGSLPGDQDRITSDVWLTRDTIMGLFNAALEGSYTHYFSPTNTEWAYGTLSQYASLTYTNWEAWYARNPAYMLANPAVLHLISDNIYIGVQFTSWGERAVGGWSYERTTQSVPEASSGLLMLAGLAVFGARRRGARRSGIRQPFHPIKAGIRGGVAVLERHGCAGGGVRADGNPVR
jgi:hypothetical protein